MVSGLQEIINEIQNEALKEAEAIKAATMAAEEEILAESACAAGKEAEKIQEGLQRKLEAMKVSSASALEQQRRQSFLEIRQEILQDTLKSARESIQVLPAEAYFALCKKLALAHAEAGEGILFFGSEDLARLPADFGEALAKDLPREKTIRIADEAYPIDSGFVLQYGAIQQNCSFSALFDGRQEEFLDGIVPILFPA